MSLKDIFCEARSCELCYPGQEIYVPLPDPNNSDGKADIVFVNERPGRIGTGGSGYVSFDNNDASANFFRECFELVGLSREKVFITNACLCYPLFDGYRDTAPSSTELKNCHFWLRQQLELAAPKLIVTVGQIAFKSVLRYFNHWPPERYETFLGAVGQPVLETEPWIFPLAHTSRRGRAMRRAELQRADWLKIPDIMNLRNSATKQ
jgi:uracil-DNA glycosylase family 4